MESSAALVQVASRLEKYMAGSKGDILKDSLVAQISAFLYYQSHVVASLEANKGFQQQFSKIIFEQIDKDFGEYIDALARSRPKTLHHMYEWKRVGQKSARLFTISQASQEALSFKISVDYKLSKSTVPGNGSKRRHVFANKARIMEAGEPLVIRPRNAQRLVFKGDEGLVFMPKGRSVTVKRPGGAKARNQFGLATSRFFNSQLINSSIKRSGFQNVFNAKMSKALKIPTSIKTVRYSFSPNTVRLEAESSLALSFGGAL